jgi:hypothetical protein
MMRVCHLDTCPVGIATQNPSCGPASPGKPEFVETLLREYIARRSASTSPRWLPHASRGVGHVDALDTDARSSTGRRGLDLTPVLTPGRGPTGTHTRAQDHGLEKALDHELITLARAPRARRAGPGRSACATSTDRRHDARPRGDQARTARPADGHVDHADRLDAAVVRAFCRAAHAAASATPTTSRQGPLGRPRRRAPGPVAPAPPSTTSSPATSSPTARRPASSSCAARSASGSASATPARPRSSRAWATTAAST